MSSQPPKEGTRFRFRKLTFFASCGMVRIIDDSNGDDKYVSPMEMRLRARAFAADAERMRQTGWKYRDEIREHLVAAKEAMQAVKEAEEQGCPLDPRVAREQAHLRRKVQVAMGGHAVPKESGPKLLLPGGRPGPAPKLIVPGG